MLSCSKAMLYYSMFSLLMSMGMCLRWQCIANKKSSLCKESFFTCIPFFMRFYSNVRSRTGPIGLSFSSKAVTVTRLGPFPPAKLKAAIN